MSKKIVRWPRLLIAVLVLLFAGVIYAWSILKAPLAVEFGWTAAQLALNFTITMCFFCLGGMLSGLIEKQVAPQVKMAVSAILIFAGFFITSRLNADRLLLLYLAYGVLGGTGIGIVYNTVISVTNAWFPDRKGLSSGLMMMGFGLSTLLLGNIAGRMIAEPAIGWRPTFVVMGVSIGLVVLLAGLVTKMPPADFAPIAVQKMPAEEKSLTTREMITRASFWKLFFFFISISAVGSTVISFARDFTIELGASSAMAVTFVGILSVCNGLGRLASGTLFDALGLRRTQYVTSAVAISAPVTTLLAIVLHSLPLGVVGICLCGFSYGFAPTVTVAFVSSFYGGKHFPLNFSIMNLTLIPASFTSTLAGAMITATNSYVPILIVLCLFSLIGLGINLTIKKP